MKIARLKNETYIIYGWLLYIVSLIYILHGYFLVGHKSNTSSEASKEECQSHSQCINYMTGVKGDIFCTRNQKLTILK